MNFASFWPHAGAPIYRDKEKLFWLWLSRRFEPGTELYADLLEHFGTAFEIFNADADELLAAIPSLTDKQLKSLCDKNLDEAYEILGYCRRNKITLICYGEMQYPISLRGLKNPPVLLYAKGKLPDFNRRLYIAVVGTRKMSEYGRRTAYKIAYELGRAGAIIVSGMALGVDSVAAGAALEAGGSTIAVLGCGIDVAYPSEHASFQRLIEKKGLVLTEYAPGVRPFGRHFPVRNRLISGLAQGVLILDAPEGSGALITAECASIQGRELFTMPANVGGLNTSGTNRLLQEGAQMVLCARDLIEHYAPFFPDSLRPAHEVSLGRRSDYDGQVLARLGVYSRTLDGEHRIPAEQSRDDGVLPPAAARPTKPKTKKEKPAAPPAEPAPQPTPQPARPAVELSERERAVFEAIPLDSPVSVDRLQSTGYGTGELLAALSMLEIKGLVHTLPGGLYSRA